MEDDSVSLPAQRWVPLVPIRTSMDSTWNSRWLLHSRLSLARCFWDISPPWASEGEPRTAGRTEEPQTWLIPGTAVLPADFRSSIAVSRSANHAVWHFRRSCCSAGSRSPHSMPGTRRAGRNARHAPEEGEAAIPQVEMSAAHGTSVATELEVTESSDAWPALEYRSRSRTRLPGLAR